MAYPFGSYDERVIRAVRTTGLVYGRTVKSHGRFDLPQEWCAWHPTCHDGKADSALVERFMKTTCWARPKLLYVWGHSFELPEQGRWDSFEAFCAALGEHGESVWHATNIEVYDYVEASRALRFSTDLDRVFNPSALDVWISVDGEPVEVPAGVQGLAL